MWGKSVLALQAVTSQFAILGILVSNPALASRLDLEIQEVVPQKTSYADFCSRHPSDCEMTGASVLKMNNELKADLQNINSRVNEELEFVVDPLLHGYEEYWAYPKDGAADCEDNALEKRRRLVNLGYPRAALRMTTAFHRSQFYAHALLLVETDQGTYVLDQDADKVVLWDEAPYIYEARERVDGRWERFVQDW